MDLRIIYSDHLKLKFSPEFFQIFKYFFKLSTFLINFLLLWNFFIPNFKRKKISAIVVISKYLFLNTSNDWEEI